jgi:hypothetical protein
MSTELPSTTAPEFPVPLLGPAELDSSSDVFRRWLWHGLLGPGLMTAFTSQGKSGKTTLASILLARLERGGTLAGLPLAAGKAIVVTEESRAVWKARCRRLAIAQTAVRFLIRPFRGARPSFAEWRTFVANLARLHRQQAYDLLLIDPLASFLPGNAENHAPAMLDFLLTLQELAEAGLAIWLLHHPAKRTHADGQAGRGTSALGGCADILIEMSCIKRLRSPDRRRRLRAYARTEDTPRNLVIELNAEGTDYAVCAPMTGPAVESWQEVEAILGSAYHRLTHQEIIEQWPDDRRAPDRSTLYRWLRRATEAGHLSCAGAGTRGDPYRYWLAARTSLMRPDESASKEEKDAWHERYMKDIWEQINRHQAAHDIRPAEGGADARTAP